MRTLKAATLLPLALLVGCATGDSPNTPSAGGGGSAGAGGGTGGVAAQAGSGGMGGTATSSTSSVGGGGGATSSSSAGGMGGMGGMPPDLCGNGMVDPGEGCDGTDFGGKTCASLGLGSGTLICNQYCGIVASSCVPMENCIDGVDNDQDGSIDCDDSDCANAPSCLDSCMPPLSANVPDYLYSTTEGRPAVHASSCATNSGKEVFYQVVAPNTGTLTLQLYPSGSNFTLSVRTACGDDTSEIKCSNVQDTFGDVTLAVDVTQGQTYFIMIDGDTPSDFGYYDLQLDMPLPESGFECTNMTDDDSDGYLDCDDPNACQGSPQCQPGSQATGTACVANTQCSATGGDPICLSDFVAWPGGYCSEFCDMAAPNCSGDAVCYDLGISVHGVCLDGCVLDTDCRAGYACVDKGLSSKVCMVGPESQCQDMQDNDGDTLTDCEDPDNCQSLGLCTPGPGAVGSPCTLNTQCQAPSGEPACLTPSEGYTGGYCSAFCNFGLNDCPTGSICAEYSFFLPSGAGLCYDLCSGPSDCRTGYNCTNLGFGPTACVPGFVPFP